MTGHHGDNQPTAASYSELAAALLAALCILRASVVCNHPIGYDAMGESMYHDHGSWSYESLLMIIIIM